MLLLRAGLCFFRGSPGFRYGSPGFLYGSPGFLYGSFDIFQGIPKVPSEIVGVGASDHGSVVIKDHHLLTVIAYQGRYKILNIPHFDIIGKDGLLIRLKLGNRGQDIMVGIAHVWRSEDNVPLSCRGILVPGTLCGCIAGAFIFRVRRVPAVQITALIIHIKAVKGIPFNVQHFRVNGF